MLFVEPIETGIDPNCLELELASERKIYSELIACHGHSVPRPDASYRTVFSNSVLEHIMDVRPVFKEVYRLLASGGRFYFTVPSSDFERYTVINLALEWLGLQTLSGRFRRSFNRFWLHHHAYSPGEWAKLAKEAGFELAEAFTFAPIRTCVLNTMLTPFAVPAKITRTLTNRWLLLPQLRRALAPTVTFFVAPILQGGERAPDGGLVFVSLRKP
jgi:SAM-dependent methyltransferase